MKKYFLSALTVFMLLAFMGASRLPAAEITADDSTLSTESETPQDSSDTGQTDSSGIDNENPKDQTSGLPGKEVLKETEEHGNTDEVVKGDKERVKPNKGKGKRMGKRGGDSNTDGEAPVASPTASIVDKSEIADELKDLRKTIGSLKPLLENIRKHHKAQDLNASDSANLKEVSKHSLETLQKVLKILMEKLDALLKKVGNANIGGLGTAVPQASGTIVPENSASDTTSIDAVKSSQEMFSQ